MAEVVGELDLSRIEHEGLRRGRPRRVRALRRGPAAAVADLARPTSRRVARCSTPPARPATEGRAEGAAGHAVRRSELGAGADRPGDRDDRRRPRTAVYLSPAPLYHAAPLVYSMSMQRLGATVVVMERFDAEDCLELIERHRVTHAQFVPTMFVRMLRLPEEVRAALRHVEPAGGDARCRTVPGAGQAPDDRVVGPDHPRVLRRHRGHRRHVHHRRRSGWTTPARSAGRRRSATSSAKTARSCRPARSGSSTSPAAGPSSTTTTPRRPRRSPTSAAGARSATWDTSTTTATSTSPTARPT